MQIDNIDGPLKALSPSLIAGYEKHNGVDLAKTNKEYKKVSNKDPLIIWLTWFKVASVISVIACAVSLTINFWFNSPVLSVVFMAFVATLIALYSNLVVTKKVSRIREIRSRCEPILEELWKAACGLDSNIWGRVRNESQVREELVRCALVILEAEDKFDYVRLQKERIVPSILSIGNWLEKSQDKFEHVLECAQKFGLEFKKSELFAEAKKKYLEYRS